MKLMIEELDFMAAIRARAVTDDDTAIIVLCDLAQGKAPADHDLDRLGPEAANKMLRMTATEARRELFASLVDNG
jgi:hypothetical protein